MEFGEEGLALNWHAIAQREEPVTFNGFINRFYDYGIGTLRGFVTRKEDSLRLGVIVKKQRIENILTPNDILGMAVPIISYLESLEKSQKTE